MPAMNTWDLELKKIYYNSTKNKKFQGTNLKLQAMYTKNYKTSMTLISKIERDPMFMDRKTQYFKVSTFFNLIHRFSAESFWQIFTS